MTPLPRATRPKSNGPRTCPQYRMGPHWQLAPLAALLPNSSTHTDGTAVAKCIKAQLCAVLSFFINRNTQKPLSYSISNQYHSLYVLKVFNHPTKAHNLSQACHHAQVSLTGHPLLGRTRHHNFHHRPRRQHKHCSHTLSLVAPLTLHSGSSLKISNNAESPTVQAMRAQFTFRHHGIALQRLRQNDWSRRTVCLQESSRLPVCQGQIRGGKT